MITENYGCKKHKLTFEEFWEEMNEFIEEKKPCPICLKKIKREKEKIN